MLSKIRSSFAEALAGRMSLWLWVTCALVAVVAIVAPLQLMVMLSKLVLVTLAAWLGYWIDRAMFPYARPHEFLDDSKEERAEAAQGVLEVRSIAFEWRMMRRAVVVVGVMLAVSLGL